jgi:hypothetical protein
MNNHSQESGVTRWARSHTLTEKDQLRHQRSRKRTGPIVWPAATFLLALLIATPALAGGTFSDDDVSVHEGAIEAIAAAGITSGCGPNEFCPESDVTREQLAAFIVRAFNLSAGGENPFSDTSSSIFEAEIAAVSKAGLVKGCNPPNNDQFCPTRKVTRAEMATFLVRSLKLERGRNFDKFSDIGDSPHKTDIRMLAKAGVTQGCNPPDNSRFCPDDHVSRAQMASFLARALNLPIPDVVDSGGGDGGGDGGVGEEERGSAPDIPEIDIPSNAVHLYPGDDIQRSVDSNGDGRTFVLHPGRYVAQQIVPKANQVFVGQAGAILDGNGKKYAFLAKRRNVTVAGLEITGYSPESRTGVIQSSGASGWKILGNNIHHNKEIGVKASAEWLVADNHIHHNSRYGLTGFGPDIAVIGNEISHNRTDESLPRGDSSGTKFVNTVDLLLKDNYVHHNNGNGLWVDINNLNPLIEDNLVVANEREGIFIEISCGGTIRDNHLEANGADAPYPSWMGEGAAILVANSPNVKVYRNTIVGHEKGIGAIHWDHPNRKSVDRCQPALKNLEVYNNDIRQSEGAVAGIDAKIDKGSVWTSWGNRFHSNSYDLSGSAEFRWESSWLSLQEWRAEGQG